MDLPTVYSRGQESDFFNQWTYWKNILIGTIYGIVSMLVVSWVMEGGVVDMHGRVSYQAESAIILYFSIVVVVNVKVLLMSHGHTPLLLISQPNNLVLRRCYLRPILGLLRRIQPPLSQ